MFPLIRKFIYIIAIANNNRDIHYRKFSLGLIGLSFSFLCSSSVVSLGGYDVSLYACLRSVFWNLEFR